MKRGDFSVKRIKTIIGIGLIAILILSVSLAFAGSSKASLPVAFKGNLTKLCFGKFGKDAAGINLDIAGTIESILGMKKEDIQKQIQSGKSFSDILKDRGLTLDQFKSKLLESLYAKIDEAVKNNKITSDKASQLKQSLKQKIDSWNGKLPFFGFKIKAFSKDIYNLDMFSDIATILGMTKDSLFNELKNGKTIADLIKSKNILESDFKNKLISMQTAKIDKLLQEGKITKDQADKMKEAIKTKISNWDLSKGFAPRGFGRKFKGAAGMDGTMMRGFSIKMRGFWPNQGTNQNTNNSSTNVTF